MIPRKRNEVFVQLKVLYEFGNIMCVELHVPHFSEEIKMMFLFLILDSKLPD